jgi:hypothetical protein
MTFRSTAAAMIVLAATTAWTQSASPAPIAPSSHPRRVAAESNVVGLSDNTRALSATRQRVEDMGNTLTRMHGLLKQMQAKTAADSTKDPLIKANLEMWGLMLADLDKQYAQLKLAKNSTHVVRLCISRQTLGQHRRPRTRRRLAQPRRGPTQPRRQLLRRSRRPQPPLKTRRRLSGALARISLVVGEEFDEKSPECSGDRTSGPCVLRRRAAA